MGADDLELSQMIGNLSIVHSPLPELRGHDDASDNDRVWDLCVDAEVIPKRKKSKKKKVSKPKPKVKPKAKKAKKASIMNTSTSTATWKCSKCKAVIAITVYVCPQCG